MVWKNQIISIQDRQGGPHKPRIKTPKGQER